MVEYNLTPTRFLMSVQDLVNYIKKGNKITEGFEGETSIEYYNSIILSPKYQRQYRASKADESSVIISLLCKIPLPEIFLVTNNVNGIPIRNVMDGQHRLSAINRFVSNEYTLQVDDEGMEEYNGKKFNDLELIDQMKIFNSPISVLEFQEITDDSLEIKLFKIYNSKQKPLSDQELTSASYPSAMLDKIESYVDEISESKSDLKNAFNMTTPRVKTQKINQEILAMLQVMQFGVENKFESSPIASGMIMKKYNEYMLTNQKENLDVIDDNLKKLEKIIHIALQNEIEYPFSAQITGEKYYRNYKFNIGIGLVYAYLIHYCEIDYDLECLFEELTKIVKFTKHKENTSNKSCANSKNLTDFVEGFLSENQLVAIKRR